MPRLSSVKKDAGTRYAASLEKIGRAEPFLTALLGHLFYVAFSILFDRWGLKFLVPIQFF